jgi:hypothetical protein
METMQLAHCLVKSTEKLLLSLLLFTCNSFKAFVVTNLALAFFLQIPVELYLFFLELLQLIFLSGIPIPFVLIPAPAL